MFYLIQKNTWGEKNYDRMIEGLERLGMGYEICRFIPFIHEVEFTTDRKDIWCFGAYSMTNTAAKYGWNPGTMANENHDVEVYGKMYGDNMLNHEGICMEFTDPLPKSEDYDMFFARPTKDTKVFSGQIFMRHSWDEYVAHVVENNTVNIITDETRILISPLKNIQQEIRCWIVGGKVITISQYKLGSRVTYQNLDHDEEAMAFAQEMVDIFQPAKAFVIDICRTSEGMKVIEVNCINSAGFYDMNFQKVIVALEQEFN